MWSGDNTVRCAISAPTGQASFNVGGITTYQLFRLPIEHEGKTAGYWSLPKVSQKVMKTNLREVSLSTKFPWCPVSIWCTCTWVVWWSRVVWIDSLLEIFLNSNLSMGMEKITQKSLTHRLGCSASVNIWKESVVYDELTINERQKEDKEFSLMLDCVRRGSPTAETIATLEDRVIQVPVADKLTEFKESVQTPMCLFPTRTVC